MDAVYRLRDHGILPGEWALPSPEAVAQAACHLRAALAVHNDLRALLAVDRLAVAAKVPSSLSQGSTTPANRGALSPFASLLQN